MPNVSYTTEKRHQKLYTKVYAVLCLIIIASMGFFSYQKWQEYSLIKTAVEKNKDLVAALRENVADEKSAYELNKEGFNSMNEEIEEKLEYIFPSADDYTSLTRQIDEFEEELSKKNNPFNISNIEYMTASATDSYSTLPFRMSIESSDDNFTKFLHLLENSGSLDDQVRLMDIQSIRLNFDEDDESDIINFTVQINAYYQS
jgi:methyl-accepting chemotaxis protein